MAQFAVSSISIALLALAFVSVSAFEPKIDAALTRATAADPSARFNIFITMRDGTDAVLQDFPSDSKGGTSFDSEAGAQQRTTLRDALRRHAEISQAELLQELDEVVTSVDAFDAQMRITSFWITNQIYVKNADASVLELMYDRDDVLRVDKEAIVTLDVMPEANAGASAAGVVDDDDLSPVPFDLGYNLELIRVTDVWANDVNGSGVVVGHIDTGVRSTHEALRASYKDDTFSWFDPVTGSASPFDGQGQGTFTMGLLAGGLEVGVAFGAQWMACRAFNAQGTGEQSNILACGQFILCPTTPDGKEEDCSQAPRVVSNGFNSLDPYANFFLAVIDAWTAAGIIPVWSAGNYGDRPTGACSTLGSHAPYAQVIAVGATNDADGLWERSSQGPSVFDENGDAVKPDLAAPGVEIRSASHEDDGGYTARSGTAMAQAHVAGVIALLLSMDPDLGFDEVKRILETTAAHDLGFTGAECAGRPDSEFPNHQFGHGRLDAFAAYECVVNEYSCLDEPDTNTTTTTTTTTSTTPSTTTTTSTPSTSTTTTTEPTPTPTRPTPTSSTSSTTTASTTTTTISTTTTTASPEPSTSEESSTTAAADLGQVSNRVLCLLIAFTTFALVNFHV